MGSVSPDIHLAAGSPPPAGAVLPRLSAVSSMATRSLLADLCALAAQNGVAQVDLQSMGGVDAARRVASGERFDIVVLAADAIHGLMQGGHLEAGSAVPLVRSPTAVAVRSGAPVPDISSAAALREAVQAARSVGCSTGPSGAALMALFERWGMAADVRAKLVTPPPGTPVGALLARGDIELGFQQLSELLPLSGVTVVGLLPDDIAVTTTFTGAIGAHSANSVAAARLLALWASDGVQPLRERHGMTAP